MKKFNVGIVGYGWAATAHLPAINACALGQVTRICSSRPLDARELSAKHGCALQTTTDYAALLADPDIQVVSICSYTISTAKAVCSTADCTRMRCTATTGTNGKSFLSSPWTPATSPITLTRRSSMPFSSPSNKAWLCR